MGDAAKVIDWNGTDLPAGVGELLAELPPGRYRLAAVPEGEEDGWVSGEEPGDVLPAEVQDRVRAGMKSIAEGRGVPLAEVEARLRATLAAPHAR